MKKELENFRYEKCKRCYWYDNCPLNKMSSKEIAEMKIRVEDIDINQFSNFDNCKSYYEDYCEYFTPFDDYELSIVDYEINLRERENDYEELLSEYY